MAVKPLHNIWIRRQQCPCGDWKCYIKYEGDDQSSISSQRLKSELFLSSSQETAFTPYVGQIFKTDDEANESYSKFARKNGFSIRRARSTESQNLGVYRRDFVCYCSGFNQPRKKANVQHHRESKSVRCGCDAKLYLTKEIVDGVPQWYISQFSNVHNHELLEDDQVRLLPAYRKIEESDQERIVLLSKAGFPVNRIVKVLELEKGVQPGQLSFTEKDVRNFVRSCKKTVKENDTLLSMKRDSDLMELLDACKVEAEKDEGFSYSFTIDDDGKVENIAWAYGDSVRAFSLFGDVLTIDTSYRSITYVILVAVATKFGSEKREEILYLPTKMCLPLEEHARTVLTPFAFSALQHELVLSMQYAITEMANGSYIARHYKDMERECLVILIPDDEQVHCSCKEFEYSGTLCRHLLRVLTFKNYFQIPEKYFLLRWRLDSSVIPSQGQIITGSNNECSQAFYSITSSLFSESFLSKEKFNFVHGKLTQLLEDVRNTPVSDQSTVINIGKVF
ncbi:hypothetical protein OROGR_015472 [Orobanche gracilis]